MQLTTPARIVGGTIGLGTILTAPLFAAAPGTMDVAVNIPRLKVAEYHKPYVAIWVEKEGAKPRTVAVWYDYDMKANEGTKWLRDVRQWWRAAGRSMTFTRAQLGASAPGQYMLVIEAAREVGGRELLRIPFTWPAKAGAGGRAAGKTELGAVSVSFR